MDISRISIQHGSAVISAEGSESLIRDALAFFKENLLTQAAALGSTAPKTIDNGNTAIPAAGLPDPPTQSAAADVSGLQRYENVYDRVDDKLKIIATVPGKNNAEKTRNVALLILFGHFTLGVEQVPSEVIRQACIDQGCFDSTNFAQYLKGLKSRVVMNTKAGGGYDVKLTAPGRKDAREFVEKLNGDE